MEYTIAHPTKDTLVLTPLDREIVNFSDQFRLTPETTTEPNVVLDMAAIEFLPSSALGQVLGLAQRLKHQGRRFSVIYLHPDIARVFEITKLGPSPGGRGEQEGANQGRSNTLWLNRVIAIRIGASATSESARIHSSGDDPHDGVPANSRQRPESDVNTAPSITDEDRRFAADFEYANEQLALGEFDQFAGQFVGIYQQEVVLVGNRETELRVEFESQYGVDGSKLAVKWIEGHEVR